MDTIKFDYLSDIIVAAVEGGIDYWALVKNYHWKTGTVSVDIKVDDRTELVNKEQGRNIWHHITGTDIRAAMDKIVSGKVKTNKYIIGACAAAIATQDAIEIDAAIADVIVQVAIVNEHRYA